MDFNRICTLAEEEGFDPVGVTLLTSLDAGEEALTHWVKQGHHAEMKYLEDFSARKKKMLAEIPDAKSVICLGVNYFSKIQSTEPQVLAGRVARYAWGRDYHQVIRERHTRLIQKISKEAGPSFRAFSCVDIQPLPERFAAIQAGFGFFGKHTGILNSGYGPWLFLSEIVTNLELPVSEKSEGDCGTCVKCQNVCPTGALDEDYRLDARKCIAYWTIEHKGVIPRQMRPLIQDWIFGCDACLEICPFTSKQKETTWPELTEKSGSGPWLLIRELFDLESNSQYEKRFAGTALLRAGKKQMLRNACIVLGNSRDERALPLLEKALHHAAELVRIHAVWALAQFQRTDRIQTALTGRLKIEVDALVKAELLHFS